MFILNRATFRGEKTSPRQSSSNVCANCQLGRSHVHQHQSQIRQQICHFNHKFHHIMIFLKMPAQMPSAKPLPSSKPLPVFPLPLPASLPRPLLCSQLPPDPLPRRLLLPLDLCHHLPPKTSSWFPICTKSKNWKLQKIFPLPPSCCGLLQGKQSSLQTFPETFPG